MLPTARIWLVRHAPAALTGICYGQSDVPVLVPPDEAARLVAERWTKLSGPESPEIWSSPWARTREVAESLARFWQTTCTLDPRLSELSFGEWEGRPFVDIERSDRQRFKTWMRRYDSTAPPGGETTGELEQRFVGWWNDRRESERPVLAFTHAGIIRMARSLEQGISYAKAFERPVDHLHPGAIGMLRPTT